MHRLVRTEKRFANLMLRTKNFVVFCALTNTHHLATRGEIIGLSRISWGKWDYRRYESCVMEIYTYI